MTSRWLCSNTTTIKVDTCRYIAVSTSATQAGHKSVPGDTRLPNGCPYVVVESRDVEYNRFQDFPSDRKVVSVEHVIVLGQQSFS